MLAVDGMGQSVRPQRKKSLHSILNWNVQMKKALLLETVVSAFLSKITYCLLSRLLTFGYYLDVHYSKGSFVEPKQGAEGH